MFLNELDKRTIDINSNMDFIDSCIRIHGPTRAK